ncbi:MAG: DNA-processing protein DprA [Parcubacteria group bacterium]|jgi:DNA processing protein
MEENEKELLFWHAFNNVFGFGPQRYKKLSAFFPDLKTAWHSPRQDLLRSGIGEKQTDYFLTEREKISPEKLFAELLKEKIEIITINSESYPPLLKEIPSAPAVIYVKGNINILNNKAVAVVGSRKFTAYGQRVAENLSRDLARSGLSIVSGLALGIDAVSHRATLSASGATLAILGSGLDDPSIFPRENFNLARSIVENDGALLSEYPPRTPSFKQNFPARNRIMAGLTLGTLVVEAALDSGSLITAGLALDFGREVFAVPGPIFSPQSAGTNYLIKNGAKLVESSSDVLQELRIASPGQGALQLKVFEPKTREEKSIWNVLSSDPLHVDKISKMTKLNPATVGSVLSVLEVEEAVKNVGGQNYIKI